MRKLKDLSKLRVLPPEVVNEQYPGSRRPATKAEIAEITNAFAAAFRQGNVTVNGKPVDPVTGKIAARKRR